jgi:hypothetical protein
LLVARLGGFTKVAYFDVEPAVQAPVGVSLDPSAPSAPTT